MLTALFEVELVLTTARTLLTKRTVLGPLPSLVSMVPSCPLKLLWHPALVISVLRLSVQTA